MVYEGKPTRTPARKLLAVIPRRISNYRGKRARRQWREQLFQWNQLSLILPARVTDARICDPKEPDRLQRLSLI